MMRKLVLATLIGLAGTAGATALPGRILTFERVVSAGHTLKITSMSAIDQGCRSVGPFAINLMDPPSSGRVEVAQGSDFPNFSTLNTRSRCNTRKLPATLVYYTAASGFAGEDDFTIEIIGPQGQVGHAHYHVSVR